MSVNRRLAAIFSILILLATAPPSRAQNDYELGPDSLPQAGVPKGRVIEATYVSPEDGIYPGTTRRYWVYIRAPIVFDNLIHKGEMPVTIGVFLNPGTVLPARPHAVARRNRSYEYDTMSDVYARFLIEQFLPMVEREHHVQFSTDPDMRGIAGLSTGGIAAFTVAWERPGSFHKVVTYIGTYVNIRNGDQYPGIIRKTSPIGRPLRIWAADGENDLDNNHGNWPLANLAMDAALEYMGYDHKLVVGHGSHSGNHGGSIFPDAMRWIWRDWKSN
jgi:enterochelin esterase family protein